MENYYNPEMFRSYTLYSVFRFVSISAQLNGTLIEALKQNTFKVRLLALTSV
jgi:hypothetical protein